MRSVPAILGAFISYLNPDVIHWTVFALVSLLAMWLLYVGLLRDRSLGRKRCPRCWYDMRGSPGLVCPECGQDAKHERRLHKTRRRWRFVLLALVIFWAATYSFQVRFRLTKAGESWRTAFIPDTALIISLPWTSQQEFALLRVRFLRHSPQGLARWQERLLVEALVHVASQNDPTRSTSEWTLVDWIDEIARRYPNGVTGLARLMRSRTANQIIRSFATQRLVRRGVACLDRLTDEDLCNLITKGEIYDSSCWFDDYRAHGLSPYHIYLLELSKRDSEAVVRCVEQLNQNRIAFELETAQK